MEFPEDFVSAIQKRVKREHIAAQYKIPVDGWPDADDGDNTNGRNSSIILMELIARKCGRLRKGGDPCLRTASIMMINDFQRGRLPHYVSPPELKVESDAIKHEVAVRQDLDTIGEEHMIKEQHDSVMDEDHKVEDGQLNETLTSNVEFQPPSTYDHVVTSSSLIGDGDWDD